MRIKNIRKIEPELSRCIEVDSPDRLFAAGGTDGVSFVTHNSVAQRNIVLGCILRPDRWRMIGIDLKRVELSPYRAYSNVVLGIATTLEDALTVLRFAQQTMMKRYTELEELGLNNFLDLPESGQALLVMCDEAGELLSSSGVKALVSNTKVPTPSGLRELGEIQIGDTVFDNFGKPTVVTNKYSPGEQKRYKMTIRSEKTNTSEDFIAGYEHDWVAYFTYPDGEVEGPEKVDTGFLYAFKKEQEKLPIEERTQVRFKRG